MDLKTTSLDQALASILEDFDADMLSSLQEANHAPENELDEVALYCHVDPILSDLYKHYRTAKTDHNQVKSSSGRVEPMVEVAADRVDSAWSAVVTRILELREDTEASKLLGKRLMMLEEERLGKSRPEGASHNYWESDEAFAALREVKDKEIEEQRKQRQKEQEEEILAAFFLFYIARHWEQKSLQLNTPATLFNNFSRAA